MSTSDHVFWIASRAAGTVALVLASIAVGVGLLMGGRFVRRPGADLRVLHEALSLATLTAIAVHGFSLLGDSFLKPSLLDILVPFAGSYRPFWTSLGIVSGWTLVALGLSYYARGRIGPARWRMLHRFTALAWMGGVAHGIGQGTDAGQAWWLITVGAVVLPAFVLLVARITTRPSPTTRITHDPAVT
jgi:methionine sulfoxide reductase heme-binding subunit